MANGLVEENKREGGWQYIQDVVCLKASCQQWYQPRTTKKYVKPIKKTTEWKTSKNAGKLGHAKQYLAFVAFFFYLHYKFPAPVQLYCLYLC